MVGMINSSSSSSSGVPLWMLLPQRSHQARGLQPQVPAVAAAVWTARYPAALQQSGLYLKPRLLLLPQTPLSMGPRGTSLL